MWKVILLIVFMVVSGCALFSAKTALNNNKSIQDSAVVGEKAAIDFFEHSQYIDSKITDPTTLAGSLVFLKEGETPQYISIINDDMRAKIKQQNIGHVIYHGMMETGDAEKYGISGFFGAGNSNDNKFETTITELWCMNAPVLSELAHIPPNLRNKCAHYSATGYKIRYIQGVNYSSLVTTRYRINKQNVYGSFMYLDAEGNRYAQDSNYIQKERIAIQDCDAILALDLAGSQTEPEAIEPGVVPSPQKSTSNESNPSVPSYSIDSFIFKGDETPIKSAPDTITVNDTNKQLMLKPAKAAIANDFKEKISRQDFKNGYDYGVTSPSR